MIRAKRLHNGPYYVVCAHVCPMVSMVLSSMDAAAACGCAVQDEAEEMEAVLVRCNVRAALGAGGLGRASCDRRGVAHNRCSVSCSTSEARNRKLIDATRYCIAQDAL